MLGSVVLRLGLALILATSLLMINTSVAGSAGRLVDQDAKITLMPTMNAPVGATGEAELRLRIDEEHMLEIFRVKPNFYSRLGGPDMIFGRRKAS